MRDARQPNDEQVESGQRFRIHNASIWDATRAYQILIIPVIGYWTRASDFSIYRDPQGKFHVFPCDMNEAFREPEGGPGGPGGMRRDRPSNRGQTDPGADVPQPREFPFPPAGGLFDDPPRTEGVKLDPLVALDVANKPLRSKLLAVPALRARYLADVRTLAEEDLAWKNLGPVVAGFRSLIETEVAADTRKLSTTEEFLKLTANEATAGRMARGAGGSGRLLAEPRGKDGARSQQRCRGGRRHSIHPG